MVMGTRATAAVADRDYRHAGEGLTMAVDHLERSASDLRHPRDHRRGSAGLRGGSGSAVAPNVIRVFCRGWSFRAADHEIESRLAAGAAGKRGPNSAGIGHVGANRTENQESSDA